MNSISTEEAGATRLALPDVVQITSVHRAFDTRIFAKISCALADNGYKVLLLAPHSANESISNVTIKALRMSSNRLARIFLTSLRATRDAVASGAKVCHFHDPELMPAGILLKLLGRKVIYDVHEDYSKTIATKAWLPFLFRRPLAQAIRLLEWLTALCVDQVFAATPTIAQHFPPGKTVILQNFPIQGELVTDENKQVYATRPPIIAYIGGLTPERGSFEMVQAIGLVDQKFEASLYLAGNITPDSLHEKMKETSGWERTVAPGFCDRRKVLQILSQSRVGLVVLHPHPNYVNALATKMFEYMSAGLPVIASDFPLWREIINGAGAGLLVDPMDPNAIAKAIEWILDHPEEAEDMGKRGLEAVRSKYNWAEEEKKLIAAYDRLLGSSSSRHVR